MITGVKKIKKRGGIKNIIFLGLIFLAIISFLVFSNWRISQERAELQEKRDFLEKEIQVLEERVANLRAGIKQTESDDYQTEKLYQEGYFPEGAVPVVVLPAEEKKDEEEKTVVEEKNPWHKFLGPLRNFFKLR